MTGGTHAGLRAVAILWRVLGRIVADARVPRTLRLLGLASTLLTLASVSMPLVTRRMVGHAIRNWAPSELAVLALASVVASGHVFWLGLLRRRGLGFLEAVTEQAVAREVVRTMLRLPLREIERNAPDLPMLLGDARAVGAALPALLTIAVDTFLGALFLVALGWIDPAAAIAAVAVSCSAFGASVLLGLRFRRAQRDTRERAKAQTRLVSDLIAGCESIKANVAERGMVDGWRRRLVAENAAGIRTRTIGSVRRAIHGLADRWTFAAVVLTGGLAALDGTRHAGDIVAAFQAAAGWGAVLAATAALPLHLATLRELCERVAELDALGAATTDDPSSVAPRRAPIDRRAAPLVFVEGVSFRYADDAPWVLADLSLSIEAGERVLLRWPSGRGKSTLMRILSGLVVPEHGRVLVDGRAAHDRMAPIAYLPQASALLPLTMRENLRIFSRDAPEDRIDRAMKETGLDEIVAGLAMGKDTMLSGGSRTLSSGQAHLVLLTAILASDSRLLLLDEAFAHLDARLQARVLDCPLLVDRTVVLVTHEASSAFGGAWREI